jgi:hypothetical protein
MCVFSRILIFLTCISLATAADVCYENVISNSSTAITALILARGGSKGIKLKNIQRIDGISLLGISLTELQIVKTFESIWVSTDHEEIAKEAEKCLFSIYQRVKSSSVIFLQFQITLMSTGGIP